MATHRAVVAAYCWASLLLGCRSPDSVSTDDVLFVTLRMEVGSSLLWSSEGLMEQAAVGSVSSPSGGDSGGEAVGCEGGLALYFMAYFGDQPEGVVDPLVFSALAPGRGSSRGEAALLRWWRGGPPPGDIRDQRLWGDTVTWRGQIWVAAVDRDGIRLDLREGELCDGWTEGCLPAEDGTLYIEGERYRPAGYPGHLSSEPFVDLEGGGLLCSPPMMY